jgi:hypothetical protein
MATTVSAAVGNAASLVVGIWQFLKDTANLAIITAMAAGAWAVFNFLCQESGKREHGAERQSRSWRPRCRPRHNRSREYRYARRFERLMRPHV